MLFPLYLLLATAMTMLTSLTCDLSPVLGLTNQTFGISVGVVHGQITFEVYGDDFATKKQVCERLVCVISLWAADVVFLTLRAALRACCSFWTTDPHSYSRARETCTVHPVMHHMPWIHGRDCLLHCWCRACLDACLAH